MPAKWYPTEDGLWIWKGDTSSDEVNGHYFAVCLFHDLAAKGAEKERAAQHIANITSHIIDNGWVLRDMDGKPTRWGRWDPEYLLRPYGFESRGLNGMEAQSYVEAAYALTGDPKFQAGLEQLRKWRYHTYTVRQKMTFPPDSIAPWDDELAFWCYYPLLRYAKDPELRSIYLRSLERSWEVLRMQQLPFFNFIYGALDRERLRSAPSGPASAGMVAGPGEPQLPQLAPQRPRRRSPATCRTAAARGPFRRGNRKPNGAAAAPSNTTAAKTAMASRRPSAGWRIIGWAGITASSKRPRRTIQEATALPARAAKPRGAAPYNGPARPVGGMGKVSPSVPLQVLSRDFI